MSKVITDLLNNFESETPTLQNQHKRISLIGCLPLQANTNFEKDKNGVESYWAQLLCNYTSSYNRTDETGQQHGDNASLKTLVIKFPMSTLKKYNISSQDFKSFFDKNFVAKKWLLLPVTEEKQSFQYVNDKRVPIKNQTEVTIDDSFDLNHYFKSFSSASK